MQRAMSQDNVEEEEQGWKTYSISFKIHYKIKVIKTVWYLFKDKRANRTKEGRSQNRLTQIVI